MFRRRLWQNQQRKDRIDAGLCRNPVDKGRNCNECANKINKEAARRYGVINAYGGKCNCCGEDVIEFLAVDHIYGNGKLDRAKKAKVVFIDGLKTTIHLDIRYYAIIAIGLNLLARFVRIREKN